METMCWCREHCKYFDRNWYEVWHEGFVTKHPVELFLHCLYGWYIPVLQMSIVSYIKKNPLHMSLYTIEFYMMGIWCMILKFILSLTVYKVLETRSIGTIVSLVYWKKYFLHWTNFQTLSEIVKTGWFLYNFILQLKVSHRSFYSLLLNLIR